MAAAILLLVSPTLALGETAYEEVADRERIERDTAEAAQSALDEAESLATSISFAFDYLTTFVSEAHPPDYLTHAELKATTDRLDGVRSILVVSEDGAIRHDAFSFPAPKINVAERQYFQQAMLNPGLVVGERVVGRTSGVPFIPVSIYKPALNGVLTAIVDPRKLRDSLDWCRNISASCGGAIVNTDGAIVTASPARAPIHKEVSKILVSKPEWQGTFIYERPNFRMLVAFRKSERFPIIVWASQTLTSNGMLATQ
ncbi:hypothetical protein QMT40_002251 [Parvibaculaceae bacterium PLY_AMNH_Bact1]|nr:hypothetical protein QMT40_002251 [Parvibaculaceae bacterium PLY_AMNH_Bact1]